MKQALKAILLPVMLLSQPGQADDYVITVNGTSTEIGLDRERALELPDGTRLNLTLHQKDYLRFQADLFSFEHKNEYKPNRNDLGEGIYQTMIVTPLGTGIILQEYMHLNPAMLVDMMVNELTKEEVEYGYKFSEEKASRKVGDAEFVGKRAKTSYPGEEWTRTVLARGGKDKGLLVVTFIEKENYEKEKGMIEHLWESLELSEDLR